MTVATILMVDVPAIFRGVYDRASYDLRIDYTQPPLPPAFREENQIWIRDLLHHAQGNPSS
jgi:hypothetical protein